LAKARASAAADYACVGKPLAAHGTDRLFATAMVLRLG
jgi:hypothetical protein